jgi:hypothetical protein
MKPLYFLLFVAFFAGLTSCKKPAKPAEEITSPKDKPEEITPPKQRQLFQATVKYTIVGKTYFGKNIYNFSYDEANRVVKVTQTGAEVPIGVTTPNQGDFDTYEYDDAGHLTKISMNKYSADMRKLVLLQYNEYIYDFQGKVVKVIIHKLTSGPPDGSTVIRQNNYYNYFYNTQNQMAAEEHYILSHWDMEGNQVYKLYDTRRFQYDPNENLVNINKFIIPYTGGAETLTEITKYNNYDNLKDPIYTQNFVLNDDLIHQKTPLYDRDFVVNDGIIKPFASSKNNMLDMTVSRYNSGVEYLTITTKRVVTTQGTEVSSIKEEYVKMNSKLTEVGTGTSEWEFKYKN